MIPTPFETSGTKTSFVAEAQFWTDLVAASPRVSHAVIGTSSTMGRPMRFIAIGNPAPVAPGATDSILLTAMIHGSEPATREMAMALARDLSFTTDPEWLAYLAAHPLYIMPTCNPDSIESGDRNNAANANINRDHLQLTQGESLAIAQGIYNVQPTILWDAHEYGPGQVLDMQPIPPSHPQIAEPTRFMGEEIRQLVESTVTSNGWSYGSYTFASVTEPRMLCNAAALIHSMPSFTPETPYARALADRVTIHRQLFDAMMRWHRDHTDRIRAHTAESRQRNTDAGARATEAFRLLDSDVVLFPPPAGYQLTETQHTATALRRQLFGIQTVARDGGWFVSMAQPAQSAVPFLFDPQSNYRIATGQRVAAPKRSGTPVRWGPIKVDGMTCPVTRVQMQVGGDLVGVWSAT